MDIDVIREPINLDDYEPLHKVVIAKKQSCKERIVKTKYPNAQIYALYAEQIKTKGETVVDTALFLFTDAPTGTIDMMHAFNNLDQYFFLVVCGNENLLVLVTDDFIETRKITQPIIRKKFEMCGFKFKVGALIK